MSLQAITREGSAYDQLSELAGLLASAIDECDNPRELASLARQYRETVRAISDMSGDEEEGDAVIDELISQSSQTRPRRAD